MFWCNESIYKFASPVEFVINDCIGNTNNGQSVIFKNFGPYIVITLAGNGVVLRPVNFNRQLGGMTIKINNKIPDGLLSLESCV